MRRAHIPPTIPFTSPSPAVPPLPLSPPAYLPELWSSLERPHQRQLAQHWAELIRRIRRPAANGRKEAADEHT